MVRIKIEFINQTDLDEMIEHISKEYVVIEKGKIKKSLKKDSKFKFQFIDLMKKEEVK